MKAKGKVMEERGGVDVDDRGELHAILYQRGGRLLVSPSRLWTLPKVETNA